MIEFEGDYIDLDSIKRIGKVYEKFIFLKKYGFETEKEFIFKINVFGEIVCYSFDSKEEATKAHDKLVMMKQIKPTKTGPR